MGLSREIPNPTPEQRILAIKSEVAVLGFNDSELPELDRLLQGLRDGKIPPDVALNKAQSILDSKQDYH